MTIVVAYKWAADPADAAVGDDGAIAWGRTSLSEYDPVAIEVGRCLADAVGEPLVGVTVGGPDAATPMARKAALARGLDRLVVVAGEPQDTTPTALNLAEVVRGLAGVRVVLTGDASVDAAAKMVGPVLAGALGWPCLTDVTAVRAERGALTVTRRVPGGTQTVALPPPAVLACAPDAATPRTPGMRDILAAGRKPVDIVDAAALPPATAEVRERRRAEARPRRRDVRTVEDPDADAAALVAALRAAGVLEGPR